MIDKYLLDRMEDVVYICKKNNVKKLFAFGSIVDGRFISGKSDIDFMLEFDHKKNSKKARAKHLLIVWLEFQNLFNCKVDIVTIENIEGKYFKKYLDLYKVEIYSDEQRN